MAGIGIGAAVYTARIGRPVAVPVTLGYFAGMEILQTVGYLTIDRCSTPANEAATFLAMLHIAFQPFVINAFAIALLPGGLAPGRQALVYVTCGVASTIMLMQLYPFEWAGACPPGSVLCGPALCTVSGTWHLAWEVPLNDLLGPLRTILGPFYPPFPAYLVTVILLPALYGAWRFALMNLLLGPMAISLLATASPTEVPAIWCLLSVGIAILALNPALWRHLPPPRVAPSAR
jgi:hypothetical protein